MRKKTALPKKSESMSSFTGRWRIVSMSAWDQEFIDAEEDGYVSFDQSGNGQFHFGYVHGHMDCRLMTVMDQGETLEVRFGPIPLFRKTVQYADIVSVELVGQYYSTAGEFT